MKKLLKSAGAIALGAAFAFSAFACTNGDDSSSSSNGNKPTTGKEYLTNAIGELASAKSVKLVLNGEASLKSVYGNETKNDETGEVTAEALVARTETGVNAEIKLKTVDKDNLTKQTQTVETSVYFIDGYVYSYVNEKGYYEVSSVDISGNPAFEYIFDMIGEADLGAFDTEELVEALASLLQQYGTVTDTSASISFDYDAATVCNGLIAFINGIDEEKTTVEEAINLVLKMLEPTWTTDVILDSLKAFGPMTLSALVDTLDGMLAETGMTLTDIKNAIFAELSEEDLATLEAALGLPDGTLSAFKNATVKEILESMGLDGMTVNELIGLIMAGGGDQAPAPDEEEVWTKPYALTATDPQPSPSDQEFDLATFIDEVVKPFLKNTTLTDLGISLPALDGITVTKAKAGAKLVLGKTEIEEMSGNLEFAYNVVQTIEGSTATDSFDIKLNCKVENISASPVEVKLPEGAKTVYAIWNESFEGVVMQENCSAYIDFGYGIDETGKGTGSIWISSANGSLDYEFEYQAPAMPAGSVTITVTGAIVNGSEVLTNDQLLELLGGSAEQELEIFGGMIDLSAFYAELSSEA